MSREEPDPRFARLEVDVDEPSKVQSAAGVMPGSRVRDLVTGFEGVAWSRTEFMYGCNRVGIEPTTLKDGKPMEVEYFDEQRVEVLEAVLFDYPPEKFKQGSKVRDTVTGYSGIVIGRTVFRYGNGRVHIQPEALHDGKPIDSFAFDESRVEIVEEKKPPVSAQSEARTGGPQNDRIRGR